MIGISIFIISYFGTRMKIIDFLGANSFRIFIFKLLIIFMKDRKIETSQFYNVLNTLYKRTIAYSFRVILLSPDWKLEKTVRVRHYDYQCEGVELMFHILRSTMEKKKMQAFMELKTEANRKSKRVSSSSNGKNRYSRKRPVSKDASVNTSICITRPNSSQKQNLPYSKKIQLHELFSKVKFIANTVVIPLDQSTISYENIVTKQNNPRSIIGRIDQLETNIFELIDKNNKSKTNSNASTASTMLRKIRDRQKGRNIRIEKLDIYI